MMTEEHFQHYAIPVPDAHGAARKMGEALEVLGLHSWTEVPGFGMWRGVPDGTVTTFDIWAPAFLPGDSAPTQAALVRAARWAMPDETAVVVAHLGGVTLAVDERPGR
jgi:hypothetical protein